MSNLFPSNWVISLDPKQFRFRLQPSRNVENSLLTIKELSMKDCLKFGTEWEMDEPSADTDDCYIACAICDKWLKGFCLKHPFIFIQENKSIEYPYSVFDTFPSFMFLAPSCIPFKGYLSFSKEAEKSGYSWQIPFSNSRRVWVDAIRDDYSNWMRYSNTARFEQEQNIIALLYNQNIYYYTYKPVPAFAELLTWYGANYGKCLKIRGAENMIGSRAPMKKTKTK